MAPKIHTPVKDFTGEVAGVAFAKGVGETDDPIALGYFERRGYTIEKPAEKKAPAKQSAPKTPAAPKAPAEKPAADGDGKPAAEGEKPAE